MSHALRDCDPFLPSDVDGDLAPLVPDFTVTAVVREGELPPMDPEPLPNEVRIPGTSIRIADPIRPTVVMATDPGSDPT